MELLFIAMIVGIGLALIAVVFGCVAIVLK